jgi:hypothetical protein
MTLSNPPVHLGAQPDFTVLTKLLSDARRRLRPDGEAWIVAQRYVPMGAMCAAAGAGDATCVDVDDRFAVWVVKVSEEGKVLKDRHSQRERGRMGTSVKTLERASLTLSISRISSAEETTTTTKEKKEKKKKKDSKDSKDSKKKKKKEKREKKR